MRSKAFNYISLFVTLAMAVSCNKQETKTPLQEFEEYSSGLDWQVAFEDDMKSDYANNWVLDGEHATLSHSELGLDYWAGMESYNDAHHAVLWTKQKFTGSLKIEYDFTRLDTTTIECVNILYLHATGSGKDGYKTDIFQWNDLRKEPAMDVYFNHMQAYHISYAVNGPSDSIVDYVRARRYIPETGRGLQGTALTPEYINKGLFEKDVMYHITVLLHNNRLYMRVANENDSDLFWFDTNTLAPLTEGHIGLRHMWTRGSRYANFRVSEVN